MADSNFTTGPAPLPDVGQLIYNGCLFSPLFETSVSGTVVKDAAGRTTKCMEYTLTADGYVTMPAQDSSIAPTMANLRRLLTAQGGYLTYIGRGFNLAVNNAAGNQQDVAWGPVPRLLEFQPLGGGRSAKVKWQVVVAIPEVTAGPGSKALGEGAQSPLLQFNYETSLSYGEDGYSSLSIRGTMEIPMTRSPSQQSRRLTSTVDNYRQTIEDRLLAGIDLSRFRLTRREFGVSRDKRTMEFDFELDEKPYMDLPMYCTMARGSYNVRPARAGAGLASWHCTLKATYTVRGDYPRRVAWDMFLWLLRRRMEAAENPDLDLGGPQNPPNPPPNLFRAVLGVPWVVANVAVNAPLNLVRGAPPPANAVNDRKALLIDFSIDEGLYLDSKTVSFSATWRLTHFFANILLASGLWVKAQERGADGSNLWATTMRDVSGSSSWLENRLDPALDVIVDFGGG